MPYSDAHEAIFLHIPKTGGTTIEQRLGIQQFYDAKPDRRPTPQHYTAAMLRGHLGEEKWASYYRFTVVRNPWARLLSSYFWRQTLKKERPVLPFDDFVDHAGECVTTERYYEEDFGDHFIPQVAYTEGVQDVFRFETFAESVHAIAKCIGLTPPNVPPKATKPHDNYRAYFSDRARDRVADIYARDIETFGYEY